MQIQQPDDARIFVIASCNVGGRCQATAVPNDVHLKTEGAPGETPNAFVACFRPTDDDSLPPRTSDGNGKRLRIREE